MQAPCHLSVWQVVGMGYIVRGGGGLLMGNISGFQGGLLPKRLNDKGSYWGDD